MKRYEGVVKLLNYHLHGKRALVCGASEGIGKATALALSDLGCTVFPLARSEDKLMTLLESIPYPYRGLPICVDVSDKVSLEVKIQELIQDHQGFHILVNNTGGPESGPIITAGEDSFLQGFHNHVLVSSLLVRLLVPYMKEVGYGRIINIISTSVKTPIPNLGVSNTIRGAMASWSKTVAMELAPFGVTVNNVLPGYTKTNRLTYLMERTAQQTGKTIDDVEVEWVKTIPMGRLGAPEEIAAAAAFLASPAASYITGTHITIDGGRTPCL